MNIHSFRVTHAKVSSTSVMIFFHLILHRAVPMNDFHKFIFHSYQNCLRLQIGKDKYFSVSIYSQYTHILFYLSDHLQISDNIFFSSTNFINSLKIKDKENKQQENLLSAFANHPACRYPSCSYPSNFLKKAGQEKVTINLIK